MLPRTKVERFTRRHLRYSITVNPMDGGFFGLGIGFVSFGMVLPLFVASMTGSATLIGGWTADTQGFVSTFGWSTLLSIVMLGILVFLTKEPRRSTRPAEASPSDCH